jgi:transcriptional regulator with XRE-family HTH domain
MNGSELRQVRQTAGLTQVELARKLRKSQPYVSLLESGRRQLPVRVVTRVANVLDLPPTVLPLNPARRPLRCNPPDWVVDRLASLGYPGYSYRKRSKNLTNPAEVLLRALMLDPLEPRVVEALPWLLLHFQDFNHEQLVSEARELNVQNRLGFMVALAKAVAERNPEYSPRLSELNQLGSALEPYRLAREDGLDQRCKTERLRAWVRDNRSEAAAHWNLLTDLAPRHLPYAS